MLRVMFTMCRRIKSCDTFLVPNLLGSLTFPVIPPPSHPSLREAVTKVLRVPTTNPRHWAASCAPRWVVLHHIQSISSWKVSHGCGRDLLVSIHSLLSNNIYKSLLQLNHWKSSCRYIEFCLYLIAHWSDNLNY